jgi:hypothetical protein
MIPMVTRIQRELISRRPKDALRFRNAKGMTRGRTNQPDKCKLDAFRPEIGGLLAGK